MALWSMGTRSQDQRRRAVPGSVLILYGITVAGLPIRWMTLHSSQIGRVLPGMFFLEAWHIAEGLRGRPDILRINRHLATASPELAEEMAKIGVRPMSPMPRKIPPASPPCAQPRLQPGR